MSTGTCQRVVAPPFSSRVLAYMARSGRRRVVALYCVSPLRQVAAARFSCARFRRLLDAIDNHSHFRKLRLCKQPAVVGESMLELERVFKRRR
jgi:hypothetical protein